MHVELVDDLVERVTVRLLDPLVVLLQDDEVVEALRQRVRMDAEMWAVQLLGRDERLVNSAAARLLAALYPSDEVFDPPPAWWASPFGRVVLRRMGHPARERVTYAQAGAMLGITRQGVHDLLARGKLRPHPDGGVTTSSVRDRSVSRTSKGAENA
ncbi:hypothetical protein GCM10009765_68620 [Fodinicola feengrottensis]|uniref:DNA-binding protein n=2 Tax=Fodinicola feengrottensis TaxID=435914 RepID=A0ABP4UPX5_9ACTN